MIWIFPIILVCFGELVADILAKEYSLKGHWYLWIFAIVGYIVTNIFWLWALRSGSGLARGAVIFSVCTAIGASIVGIYFYGELVNKTQIIGMILGVLALVLIFWN